MPTISLLRAALAAVFLAVAAVAQVTSYHDVSSATHQTNFNNLSNQGYRLVSLSVAGTLASPRYSAVWEQVIGPAWVSSHDMSSLQFTAFRNTWEPLGYRAKVISVAGSLATRVYAAVFVADTADVAVYLTVADGSVATVMDFERDSDRIPVSVDIVGSSTGYQYVMVFEPNPANVSWGYAVDADSTEFSETRTAHGEPDHRLACIGMSDDQRYISVWYDQRVGTETVASNQTTVSWTGLNGTLMSLGQFPRVIASGGSGSSIRHAGSWAEFRTPRTRVWSFQGSSSATFASIDSYVQSIMLAEGHRAAAVAISKDGRLVHAKAFNHTESGNPVAYPYSSFRIGSCTKPVTSFAAHRAVEQGYFTMSTSPASTLGLTYPMSSSFPNVTVRSVLRFTSGIQKPYTPADVAQFVSQTSPQYPVTMAQGADWLAMQPMLFDPYGLPTQGHYSNAAFLLVGEVLRVETGQSFWNYVNNEVLAPLGITRMHVAPSLYSHLTANDVRHHMVGDLWLKESELHTDRRRLAAHYAEDLNFKRASGGMSASVVDYVRLLAGVFDLQGADAILFDGPTRDALLQTLTYPEFGSTTDIDRTCMASMTWSTRPGGVVAYEKNGTLPSNANADVGWRTDGVAWAAFFNSPGGGFSRTEMNDRLEAITSWPDIDLFPTYGLPAYPQRPRIDSVSPTSRNNVTTGYFTLTGKRMDTVTRVNLMFAQITSTSPTTWGSGYFEIVDAQTLRFWPPKGWTPGTYPLSVTNAAGTSPLVDVTLVANPTFFLGAPPVVGNQPWSVWIARGTGSGLTQSTGYGILCLSFSNQPTVVPGQVSLGLGNQFADLIISDAFQFSATTSAYRFNLPPLPAGTIYLEAVGVDLAWPSPWPVLTTNTASTTRQ